MLLRKHLYLRQSGPRLRSTVLLRALWPMLLASPAITSFCRWTRVPSWKFWTWMLRYLSRDRFIQIWKWWVYDWFGVFIFLMFLVVGTYFISFLLYISLLTVVEECFICIFFNVNIRLYLIIFLHKKECFCIFRKQKHMILRHSLLFILTYLFYFRGPF